MLKSAISLLFFLIVFFSSQPALFAAEFSLGTWRADGYHLWRTSFPINNASGASELYYPHSGNYIIGSYENRISKTRLLTIEAGIIGNITSATGSDSDWDYSKNSNLWYYGQFKTGGQSSFFKVNIQQQKTKNLAFSYGYSYHSNFYTMTDGLYTIDNYASVHSPLSGLLSTYNIAYHGLHIGLTASAPLTAKLKTSMSVSYAPLALAQGNGWWNLRSLEFKHLGLAKMLDADLNLSWTPKPNNGTLTIGYRYNWLSLVHGRETSNPTVSWDKATNIQRGFYISGKFPI